MIDRKNDKEGRMFWAAVASGVALALYGISLLPAQRLMDMGLSKLDTWLIVFSIAFVFYVYYGRRRIQKMCEPDVKLATELEDEAELLQQKYPSLFVNHHWMENWRKSQAGFLNETHKSGPLEADFPLFNVIDGKFPQKKAAARSSQLTDRTKEGKDDGR